MFSERNKWHVERVVWGGVVLLLTVAWLDVEMVEPWHTGSTRVRAGCTGPQVLPPSLERDNSLQSQRRRFSFRMFIKTLPLPKAAAWHSLGQTSAVQRSLPPTCQVAP